MFRVHYPLITQDGHADFATAAEAEAEAQRRRDLCSRSPYMTVHSWRAVRVEELAAPPPATERETPLMTFWRELNAALGVRGIAGATFGEVRDFSDFGDRDAWRVASTWAPDSPATQRWSVLSADGWEVTSWFGHAGDCCIARKGARRIELRGLDADALTVRLILEPRA